MLEPDDGKLSRPVLRGVGSREAPRLPGGRRDKIMDLIDKALFGDRFITLEEIKTTGLTSWAAPCTGSFECIVPEGTVFVVKGDQVEGATGFTGGYKGT